MPDDPHPLPAPGDGPFDLDLGVAQAEIRRLLSRMRETIHAARSNLAKAKADLEEVRRNQPWDA